MKKLNHSEILAQRLSPEQSLEAIRNPVSLLLSNIRSLYNVGSIFRTADSALAQELIMCGYTPHPPRTEIYKTALGAVDSVPWRYEQDAIQTISGLKAGGIKIIAVELTDNHRNYDTFTYSDFPLCLVLGNELTGIDNSILDQCDDAIEIPMYGVKHSLNVSVAAGIVLFEAVRAWKQFKNNNT